VKRSDYGLFPSGHVPSLSFSPGENPRYHTPEDTADTLDYAKLTAISRMIHQIVLKSVAAPSVPRWQTTPDYPFAEALTIRDVLEIFAKHGDTLKLGAPQRFLINNTLSTLDGIVARGAITPDERGGVAQAAGILFL